MDPATGTPEDVNITLLSGPLLLGFLFSYGLFGVLCVQVFMYHIAFPDDPWRLKAYVYFVLLLEVTLSVSSTMTAWWSMGSGFGNFLHLIVVDPQSVMQPPLAGLVTTLVHYFYCWRIYKLTRNVVIPVLIGSISIVMFGANTYVGIDLGIHKEQMLALENATTSPAVLICIFCGIVADIAIAIAMVTVLLSYRRKTPFQHTRSKLEQLIKFTVETGLVTSVFVVAEGIAFLTSPHSFLYLAFFYIIPKMYSNTFMATINSRMVLRGPRSNLSSTDPFERQIHSAFWKDQVVQGAKPGSGIRFVTNTDVQVNVADSVVDVDLNKNRVLGRTI